MRSSKMTWSTSRMWCHDVADGPALVVRIEERGISVRVKQRAKGGGRGMRMARAEGLSTSAPHGDQIRTSQSPAMVTMVPSRMRGVRRSDKKRKPMGSAKRGAEVVTKAVRAAPMSSTA